MLPGLVSFFSLTSLKFYELLFINGFETGSHYLALAVLELNRRYVPPCLAPIEVISCHYVCHGAHVEARGQVSPSNLYQQVARIFSP